MHALWGCMKMPPWLNILSTGADIAGTQYMRLTKRCRHLNWSLLRMKKSRSRLSNVRNFVSNLQKQASNHMKWVRQIHGWSWKIVQDRHFETKTKTGSVKTKTAKKSVSSGLETKTAVSRTTRLVTADASLLSSVDFLFLRFVFSIGLTGVKFLSNAATRLLIILLRFLLAHLFLVWRRFLTKRNQFFPCCFVVECVNDFSSLDEYWHHIAKASVSALQCKSLMWTENLSELNLAFIWNN